jgi:FlaA1/EpsC-like NDP-sugar epimerase
LQIVLLIKEIVMNLLTGKTALITGASKGIGKKLLNFLRLKEPM